MTSDTKIAWLLSLDRMEYLAACRLQEHLVGLRQAGHIPDTLMLLEHPPVFTLGRRGQGENVLATAEVLAEMGISVHASDRGGDVTYHGPGQLVGYPILDLTRYGRNVRLYVHRLEEVMIAILAEYGIGSGRRPGFPGVWVGDAKIGFIGVHISRWVTKHGFSLNIQPNLSHFALIHPCGLQGIQITSLAALLGRNVDPTEVRVHAAAAFARVFSLALQPVDVASLGIDDSSYRLTSACQMAPLAAEVATRA